MRKPCGDTTPPDRKRTNQPTPRAGPNRPGDQEQKPWQRQPRTPLSPRIPRTFGRLSLSWPGMAAAKITSYFVSALQ